VGPLTRKLLELSEGIEDGGWTGAGRGRGERMTNFSRRAAMNADRRAETNAGGTPVLPALGSLQADEFQALLLVFLWGGFGESQIEESQNVGNRQ